MSSLPTRDSLHSIRRHYRQVPSLTKKQGRVHMSSSQHPSVEASPKTSSSRWVFSESAVNVYDAQRVAFLQDQTEDKLGLYIGVYRTENGEPFVFEVVREAERRIQEAQRLKEYESPIGDSQFRKLAATLMFGEHSSIICEERVATIQTIAGSGAISIGAAFLSKMLPRTQAYFSNPAWGLYRMMLQQANISMNTYRYFDTQTKDIDFEGMCIDISNAPQGSIIILQVCGHNPTGCDPTKEQWQQLCDICKEKDHLAFFDVAYQGFATGSLEDDAFAPRLFAQNGLEFLVAQSFSKNFGLYGERVGALHFVLKDNSMVESLLTEFRSIVSSFYATTPLHGARIVTEILSDPELTSRWIDELKDVSKRIIHVRECLYNHLKDEMPEMDWTPILKQIGMFSFIGLNGEQVKYLQDKHHVYLTPDGRLSLAGLAVKRTKYLAHAIVDSYKALDLFRNGTV